MSVKILPALALVAAVAYTGSAFAFGDMNSAEKSSVGSGLSSYSSSHPEPIRLGRDVLLLAKDDIDTFRATGEASEFLKEVAARIGKLNKMSETAVLLELKK